MQAMYAAVSGFLLYLLLFQVLMRFVSILVIAFLVPVVLSARLSTDIASYDIDVKLNPSEKTISGEELLRWTNTTEASATTLRFHLYLNAFRDEHSTFMKESGGRLRGDKMDKSSGGFYGNIVIQKIRLKGGRDLVHRLRFVQPDDLNVHDRTVAELVLDAPVRPGETVVLEISFKALLPKVFARSGWADNDYFLVGQWFPKIGVFENGEWNCHQYHASSEFYADFGEYKVTINAPSRFTVGATGMLTTRKKEKDNTITHHYYARDVHDFAWTASPRYKVHEKNWKGVRLIALMQPEHEGQTGRYFESVIHALEYYEKLLGKYPHPVLTMVDPPFNAQGSAGMEYPMFITCGTVTGMGKWLKMAELVTIHEFGHQYFQGILASNEFEEAWMDEGFNQYMEGRIMSEHYPDGVVSLFGFRMDDPSISRLSYTTMSAPGITEVYRNSWEYPRGTYSTMVYSKTATWMLTLERLVGRSVMDEILRTYYQRWKFRHPDAGSFTEVVNEVVPRRLGRKFGRDMNWFFDQVLYGAPVCDYSVESIDNHSNGAKVTVRNAGEMKIPTEISVTFQNGSVSFINWDGIAKKKIFEFDEPVAAVALDPDRKNLMDLDLINNSKSVKANPLPALKYSSGVLFWFQQLLIFLSSIF